MRIAFSISGEIRGKGRPRATVRKGSKFASVYTDDRTRAYETAIKKAAVEAMAGAAPLDGPLSIALRFRMSIPKSFSAPKRQGVRDGAIPYFGAFDADNLAKSVLDALNGVCFVDDKQAMDLLVHKRPHERSGVDIVITRYIGEP